MQHNLLKERREAAGLTRTELARMLGWHLSTVSRIEAGKQAASREFLEACQLVLGGDVSLQLLPPKAKPVRDDTDWLRRAFPPAPYYAPQPLRVAYRAARCSPVGTAMLEQLDGQSRTAAEWSAIRRCPGDMNGDEQLFLLHGLVAGGVMHATTPEDVKLPMTYARPPGHSWVAMHAGPCVYFPQLTLLLDYNGSLDEEARKIRTARLDYLVAVATRPAVYLNVEVDGSSHFNRSARDAARERAVGLPCIRIPRERLQVEGFWESFEAELRQLIVDHGGKWPTFRRNRR